MDTEKKQQLDHYATLLASYTRKLNLISPNTIPEIHERHLEHCLILSNRSFPAGCRVVDWGTGGGLPAIPLAILFPEVQFIGVDAVGKKLHAVRAMARDLKLTNLEAWHGRAEQWDGFTHYSVSRATAPLQKLWSWHARCVVPWNSVRNTDWAPGLICLKGGDLTEEITALTDGFPSLKVKKSPLEEMKRAIFFKEKYILHICDTLE